MADQQDLDAHYTTMDKIFRLSLGEKGGYSGARFDGDFSLTLEQAQEKKHKFIMDHCNIKPGDKVLDIGCGWGAFIDYLDKQGVKTTGVVLAKGQADACRANGLNVHHMDSKAIKPETFGKFDAVCAMGSPEHLCSVEEFRAGKQDEIYRTYFKQVSDLLPVGGRFYCQTMVFGPNMVKFEDIKFGKTNVWKPRKSYTGEELMDLVCDGRACEGALQARVHRQRAPGLHRDHRPLDQGLQQVQPGEVRPLRHPAAETAEQRLPQVGAPLPDRPEPPSVRARDLRALPHGVREGEGLILQKPRPALVVVRKTHVRVVTMWSCAANGRLSHILEARL
jgi:cyclopropane fatty-acyl-phospholipid synthase-like methyltransferase